MFERGKVPQPESAASQYREGLAALDRGDHAKAIVLLTAVQARGGVPGTLARHYLAEAHRMAGLCDARHERHADAARHFSTADALSPGSLRLADYLARSLAHLGDSQKAIDTLDAALQRPGATSPSATIIRLALLQWRGGRVQDALRTLSSAADRRPRDAELRYQLGLIHADQGDYAAARTALTDAVRLKGRHAGAWYHLALAHAAMGHGPESAAALRRAQAMAPRDTAIQTAARVAGLRETPHAQPTATDRGAIGQLAAALVREPDLVQAFLDLPDSQRDPEIFETLMQAVRLAAERHPTYADLRHGAARIHERLGQMADAIREDDAALRINPTYTNAWIHAGGVLARLERYDDAAHRYEHALRHGADYADVHYALGDVKRRRGDAEGARHSFERALKINERYAAAKEALATLTA